MANIKCLDNDCQNCDSYFSMHGWFWHPKYKCRVIEFTCSFKGTSIFNENWELLN